MNELQPVRAREALQRREPPAELSTFDDGLQAVRAFGARRLILSLGAVLAGLFFLYHGGLLTNRYYKIISTAYEAKGAPKLPDAGDVTVFYTAARLVISDQRQGLYDPEVLVPEVRITQGWAPHDVFAGDGTWSRYYNPPFFALLLTPLTLVGVRTAYLIVIGINVAALLAMGFVIGRILRWRQPATALVWLGLFSFEPLYFAFRHAQPSIVLAILLGASFLQFEQRRIGTAAVLVALMGVKPQWLALPTAVFAARDYRILLPLAAALMAIILAPFAIVGPDAFADYVKLLLGRGSGDLTDPAFSSATLSWSGFFRAVTGSPQPVLWGLLAAVTLGAFALVCLGREPRLVMAAAIFTTVLVIPHSHPQDWVVLATAAALVFSRPMTTWVLLGTAAIFLAIHTAGNDWVAEIGRVQTGRAVYWITPASTALVLWLGLVPFIEGRAGVGEKGAPSQS